MPDELRDRVFERFARGGRATHRRRQGSGLGLAIVRAVAEAHGGAVDAATTPRAAARASCVRLPLATAPAPAPEHVAP